MGQPRRRGPKVTPEVAKVRRWPGMAECELCAELMERSGECRRFSVRARRTVPGILGGIRNLREQLAGALNDMVLQEKRQLQSITRSAATGSDDEDDDNGEDDDNCEDEPVDKADGDAPPTKKTRTQS